MGILKAKRKRNKSGNGWEGYDKEHNCDNLLNHTRNLHTYLLTYWTEYIEQGASAESSPLPNRGGQIRRWIFCPTRSPGKRPHTQSWSGLWRWNIWLPRTSDPYLVNSCKPCRLEMDRHCFPTEKKTIVQELKSGEMFSKISSFLALHNNRKIPLKDTLYIRIKIDGGSTLWSSSRPPDLCQKGTGVGFGQFKAK